MFIAVSATELSIDAQINPHFARCQYFLVINSDTMEYKIIDNSGAITSRGAGIPTAQTLAEKDIGVVLTGNCGPNAFRILSNAGIKVMTGFSGPVREAVRRYKEGNDQVDSQPNISGYLGMGRGQGGGEENSKLVKLEVKD